MSAADHRSSKPSSCASSLHSTSPSMIDDMGMEMLKQSHLKISISQHSSRDGGLGCLRDLSSGPLSLRSLAKLTLRSQTRRESKPVDMDE